MYYFVSEEKYCQIRKHPIWFYLIYLFVLTFEIKEYHLKIIEIFQYFVTIGKMISGLNMWHEKMSAFVSFSLFEFTLDRTLRNFDFESHWNKLLFFDKRYDLIEYVPWKNVWFCVISIFWVHFSHKTEQLWQSLKYFKFLLIRKY